MGPYDRMRAGEEKLLGMNAPQLAERLERAIADIEHSVEFVAANPVVRFRNCGDLMQLPRMALEKAQRSFGRKLKAVKTPRIEQRPGHLVSERRKIFLAQGFLQSEIGVKAGRRLSAVAQGRLRPASQTSHNQDMRKQVSGLMELSGHRGHSRYLSKDVKGPADIGASNRNRIIHTNAWIRGGRFSLRFQCRLHDLVLPDLSKRLGRRQRRDLQASSEARSGFSFPSHMKAIRLMLVIVLSCLGISTLLGAVPDTLSLEDLQDHPERWPKTLRLPNETKWIKGLKIEKGRVMNFIELKGETMVLESGTEVHLEVPVAGSDLVAEANKLWSKLTPDQRAIDAGSLSADPSLWPEKVKVLEQLDVSNEWGRIEPGSEFKLLGVDPDGVTLGRDDLPQHPVIVEARETDVFARARERALQKPELRSSRLVAALQGKLVDAKGQAVPPAQLSATRLFAVYFGAGWCGPCRQFSPGFVDSLSQKLAQNPYLSVIYLSNDKTPAAMQSYMQKVQMPWPGVRLEAWSRDPALMAYAKGMVPQLVILDRHGRVLADSFQNDRYVGPKGAFQELLRLLDAGAAR